MDPLRHYYLYAKHHYDYSGDVMADLKKIHAVWCGVPAEHVNKIDVIRKLLELAYVHIKACSDQRMFIEFVSDVHPKETWKVGAKVEPGTWTTNEDYYLRVVRKCLSILRLTHRDEWPFELGKADPSILPLRTLESSNDA